MKVPLWTLKYVQRTTLVPGMTFTRRDTCHFRAAGLIGTIRTKLRSPRFVCLGASEFSWFCSHPDIGSKRRQVRRRGRDGISPEFGGYVRRGLETETVEPRWNQDHYSRGMRPNHPFVE
jgi:hypothetical protein